MWSVLSTASVKSFPLTLITNSKQVLSWITFHTSNRDSACKDPINLLNIFISDDLQFWWNKCKKKVTKFSKLLSRSKAYLQLYKSVSTVKKPQILKTFLFFLLDFFSPSETSCILKTSAFPTIYFTELFIWSSFPLPGGAVASLLMCSWLILIDNQQLAGTSSSSP